MLSLPPLSLYIHIPWCVRKCPYCDFNSHQQKDELPVADYIAALMADLEQDLPLIWGRPVVSVFFGGGTPSLFNADAIGQILDGVRQRLSIRPDAEITMEANPGTIEHDDFAAYKAVGINRVSLGVQSFDEQALKALGRIHGRKEIDQSINELHRAGLNNFNIDLMYALPEQSRKAALKDIALALEAEPAHISHYQLTLEPNTLFAARPPVLPDDDLAWKMQQHCQLALAEGGYKQYEISAYAFGGQQSLHNLNYWRFGDYLGIGAGAHGKITDAAQEKIIRIAKHRHPKDYLQDTKMAERHEVAGEDLVFEFFLNQLRLRDGVYINDFSPRTGLDWVVVQKQVNHLEKQGLLKQLEGRLRPTEMGWRFLNDLQGHFLPKNR